MKTVLAALCLAALALPAQESTAAGQSYKVDFQIREDAAKPRRYSLILDARGNGNFRVGAKVPYATSLAPNGVATAYNYVDTGVSINARIVGGAAAGKVLLNSEVEITAVQTTDKPTPNPTISSVRSSINAQLTLKKPMLIASIEDPATMRRFEIEVTVTPVE